MTGSGDGLFFVFDIDGKLLYRSPGLQAFTGTRLGDADEAAWPSRIHPDDREYARNFLSAASREMRSFAAWWRTRRHDGVHVWTMITGAPMNSQLSLIPVGYMGTLDPLSNPDAFSQAGGLIGPDRGFDADAQRSALSRIERLADLTLMAASLAREIGDRGIADALDGALMKIGFSLAQLTEPPPKPTDVSVTVSPGYHRASRQVRAERRRLVARG